MSETINPLLNKKKRPHAAATAREEGQKMKHLDKWSLEHSPLGERLQELDELKKVLNEESENGTESSYREVVQVILLLIALRTERLLFFIGISFGLLFAALLFR